MVEFIAFGGLGICVPYAVSGPSEFAADTGVVDTLDGALTTDYLERSLLQEKRAVSRQCGSHPRRSNSLYASWPIFACQFASLSFRRALASGVSRTGSGLSRRSKNLGVFFVAFRSLPPLLLAFPSLLHPAVELVFLEPPVVRYSEGG
jgi:hypothetical protein